MRLIIVSGLSGSGKSVALNAMEDMGFYCIDNVPAPLLGGLIKQTIEARDALYDNIAVGVDARNREADLQKLPDLLRSLKDQGILYEVVFLHAENTVLLQRYRETRRKHPLCTDGMSLLDAIEKERELLGPITYSADLVLDTTASSIHEITGLLQQRMGSRANGELSIQVESFGFKHGVPFDADFVFDVRCIPNPYWEHKLRPMNGTHPDVMQFLEQHEITERMQSDILSFLQSRIPEYQQQRRNYLTVAIGCTGGQHRSVYLAEQIAGKLRQEHGSVLVRHNELSAAEIQTPDADDRVT